MLAEVPCLNLIDIDRFQITRHLELARGSSGWVLLYKAVPAYLEPDPSSPHSLRKLVEKVAESGSTLF